MDEHGTRYGFAGNYSSHTIGLTHNFSPVLQIRKIAEPEGDLPTFEQ